MEDYKICFLCDSPAGIEEKKGAFGNRLIVSCSRSCPTYEITTGQIDKLKEKPPRKNEIIQKVKAFNIENPNDIPVIRMNYNSIETLVTTRSRESKKNLKV